MTLRTLARTARVGDGLALDGWPRYAANVARTQGPRARVVYWGTYDMGKPRNRILLRGLREAGVEVIECHAPVWSGIEDKSQLSGWLSLVRCILIWLISYPVLIARYLRLPPHDAVVIGYMGQLDVLVMWPFARLRGVPIVWDALMSLYIATVVDRCLLSRDSVLARLLYAWEWLATRAADLIILNQQAVADYWIELFQLPAPKIKTAYIGAETDIFPPRKPCPPDRTNDRPLILFYGTLIPSHGVETIIEAARHFEDQSVDWVVIGKGQSAPLVERMLSEHPLPNLRWIPWVPYEDLAGWIHRATAALGVFSPDERADHAIPNKIFQILAAGTPLITRDSPAIRELLSPGIPGTWCRRRTRARSAGRSASASPNEAASSAWICTPMCDAASVRARSAIASSP